MAVQFKSWNAGFRIMDNQAEIREKGSDWDRNEAIGEPIPIILRGREIGIEFGIV